MMEWISANSGALSAIAATLSALVWLVYLQMLFMQLRRSRRPEILISRSASRTSDARLLISNMGAEPVYITSLIADLELGDERASAFITDNDDICADESTPASEATNEGPLASGEYMNAGSYASLMRRIDIRARPSIDSGKVSRMTLTIVASTSCAAQLVGCRRSFRVEHENGAPIYQPESLFTDQLRGYFQRRQLQKRLERDLREGIF